MSDVRLVIGIWLQHFSSPVQNVQKELLHYYSISGDVEGGSGIGGGVSKMLKFCINVFL